MVDWPWLEIDGLVWFGFTIVSQIIRADLGPDHLCRVDLGDMTGSHTPSVSQHNPVLPVILINRYGKTV